MAKDTKKRQKQLQKKNAKRKQKRANIIRREVATAAPSLSRTKEWPLEAVWISADWQDPQQLTQILLMRRGSHGHVAIGVVLIDRMCLGVKNAFGRVTTEFEYKEFLNKIEETQGAISADPNLVAKIIRESVAYASELGFRPNKDLRQALLVLGDAEPDSCPYEIEMGGPDGKPHFVAGPYDNTDKIMKTLTKKLGPDGFSSVLPVGPQGDVMALNSDQFMQIDEEQAHELIQANERIVNERVEDNTIELDDDDFRSAE